MDIEQLTSYSLHNTVLCTLVKYTVHIYRFAGIKTENFDIKSIPPPYAITSLIIFKIEKNMDFLPFNFFFFKLFLKLKRYRAA